MATRKNPWDKYCFIDELPAEVVNQNLPVKNCRKVDIERDQKYLKEMVTEFTFKLFGNIDVIGILWNNYGSICIEDSSGQPAGFIFLSIYPNLLSVPSWDWENWVERLYGLKTLNSFNTLWVHLLAWKDECKNSAIGPLIESVFLHKMFIEYVVMVVPPHLRGIDWIERYATKIFPKDVKTHECMTLYLFCANTFIGNYTYRKAVDEDNDDLMELIGSHTKQLAKKYGDFVIAELLSQHKDCGRNVVVCEKDGQAVGVVILNEVVNYELLYNELELTPFFGLQKVGDGDLTLLDSFKCADYEDGTCETEQGQKSTQGNEKEKDGKLKAIVTENPDYEFDDKSDKSDSESEMYSLVNVSSLHLELAVSEDEEQDTQYSAAVLEQDYSRELFKISEQKSDPDLTAEATTKVEKKVEIAPLMSGEPNAFTIEVFVVTPTHERIITIPLLRACFECFPDRDFAVLCSPSDCYYRNLLRFFIQPPPRSVTAFDQNVYVLHRDRMNATPSVRKAKRSDYGAIERMTKQIPKRELLLDAFNEAVASAASDLTAYVLSLNKEKIIGVAILRPEKDIDTLLEKYDLSKSCRWGTNIGATGTIEHLLLSAVFGKMARYFLRELHRMTDFSLLAYYIHISDLKHKERQRNINNILNLMVPARIRKRPEKISMELDGLEEIRAKKVPSTSEIPTHALFFSSLLMCSRTRYDLNLRIVAVGASETCIAFLEALLCTWDPSYSISFTNITIISPHGLTTSDLDYPNSSRKLMFPGRSSFHERRAHMITIRCSVNQVFGVMTAIDRKNKVLVVDNSSYLNYDYLYILCGEQFQRPSFDPRNVLDRHKEAFPDNVYIVNTETDAGYALDHLWKLINGKTSQEELLSSSSSDRSKAEVTTHDVIVYGDAIEIYCCVTALMNFGIPGKNIILIEPPKPCQSEERDVVSRYQEHFDDDKVLNALLNAIRDSEITYYCDAKFLDWRYDANTNLIRGARFRSKKETFYKSCIAMFYYSGKAVSYRTFKAITRAGIVFGGGIVINANYETNDPFIYAAGTITKYSRKYYAEHLAHRYFNLEEVGFDLGIKAKNQFISRYGVQHELDKGTFLKCENYQTVRIFEKPLLTYCKLPGGLWYLNVSKPGRRVSPDITKALNQYGQDLITGDCNSLQKQGYFKIHLNVHETIESITCLTLSEIDKNNLFSLWGKHEKILNKLLTRYEMGLIKDLFEYFRQPWAAALYQDDFAELYNNISRILHEKPSYFLKKTLTDHIIESHRANNWKKFNEDIRDEIQELFMNTEYPQLIEREVVKHIIKHRSTLPMYFNEVDDALQKPSSPLFDPD